MEKLFSYLSGEFRISDFNHKYSNADSPHVVSQAADSTHLTRRVPRPQQGDLQFGGGPRQSSRKYCIKQSPGKVSSTFLTLSGDSPSDFNHKHSMRDSPQLVNQAI